MRWPSRGTREWSPEIVWVVPSDRDRTYFRQNCSQEFLAGYLAAYRVEFRGQPGRSCGPWWRSSCRLWPRPSTWSRVECAWSTAPSRRAGLMPRTTSCGAASTAPPGSTPNSGLPARRRRHLHLRPAAGMHPRCERHFATTPVAEIVAHSGGGIVDKGAEASAMAKRLIVCCDGTWDTPN